MKDFVIGIIDGICISVGRIVCTFLSEAAILALFIVFYGIYPDYRIFGTMGIILVGLIWGIYIGIKVQRSDDLPDIASDIGAWVVLIGFMWFLLSIIGLCYLNINLVRALFTIVVAMIKGLIRLIFFRKKQETICIAPNTTAYIAPKQERYVTIVEEHYEQRIIHRKIGGQ